MRMNSWFRRHTFRSLLSLAAIAMSLTAIFMAVVRPLSPSVNAMETTQAQIEATTSLGPESLSFGDDRWSGFGIDNGSAEVTNLKARLPQLLVLKDVAFRLPVDEQARTSYGSMVLHGEEPSVPTPPSAAAASMPSGAIDPDISPNLGRVNLTPSELLRLVWDESVLESHYQSFLGQMRVAEVDTSYSGFADNAFALIAWNGISIDSNSAHASLFGRYITYRTPNIIVRDAANWDLSPIFQFDVTLARFESTWKLLAVAQYQVRP